jgi:protein-S-isoprenylcysteine O-methyltransferase Ste14
MQQHFWYQFNNLEVNMFDSNLNETIFRIFAAIALISAISISIYYRSKADKDTGEKVSRKDEGISILLILQIGGLVMWLSLFVYLINPAWMAWSKIGLPEWLRWLGVGSGLVCDGLIYWLFSSIGTNITPTVATRKEHQLVTSGPYRWVRNPLYSVGTAFIISYGLIADNWFMIAMALFAFIMLAIRLPNEEAHLIEKFGDEYRDYMKRTGRYLPRVLK